jgi:hypothetical protein
MKGRISFSYEQARTFMFDVIVGGQSAPPQ